MSQPSPPLKGNKNAASAKDYDYYWNWDKKKFERPGLRWFEGPYGFKMEDAVPFYQPIPFKGQLGIREASDANLTGDLFKSLEDGIAFNEYLLTK